MGTQYLIARDDFARVGIEYLMPGFRLRSGELLSIVSPELRFS